MNVKRQSKRLHPVPQNITREQCRAARALIDWSQADLAAAAHVARQTVVDFERGARMPYQNNLSAIRTACETAGITFISENGGGPGVRLKKRGKR